MSAHDLLDRARTLAELARYQDAMEHAARVLATEPDDVEAWCLLARCHEALNQPQQMLQAANEVVRLTPDDESGHRLASIALLAMDSPAEAASAAAEAVRLAPNDHRTHVQLALAGASKPNWAHEAYEIAQRAREINPHSADVHFALGYAAQKLKRRRRAIEHYVTALALAPDHPSAMNNLAMLRHRRLLANQAHDFSTVVRSDHSAHYAVHNLDMVAHRLVLRIFAFCWLLNITAFAMVASSGFAPGFSPARATVGVLLLLITALYVAIELRHLPRGVLISARSRLKRSAGTHVAVLFAALSVVTASLICFLPFRALDDVPINFMLAIVLGAGFRTFIGTWRKRH